MNLKIYEKEVMYRINSKYKSQRSIGEYIRKERLSQGLKQELVCKGICSVSYYSRIESNKVSPSRLYINKILGKLNKAVPSNLNNDSNQNNKELVNNLLTAMEYKNNKIVDEVYIKIKHNQDINQELYEFIYSIYYMKISHIPPLINSLHQQQIHFDNEELLLYLENLGTYYALTNKYNDAEKCLKMSIKLQNHSGLSKPSILYRYAWVLGKMNNDYQCIDYAKEADKIYTMNNNIYRSLQCKMLIAIKMSKWFPDKAINMYKKILLLTEHGDFKQTFRMSKFNLSLLLKKCNYLKEAEKAFVELLNLYPNDISLKFNIYLEYIDLLYVLSRYEEAIKYYNKLKLLNIDTEKYLFFIKYYDYRLQNKIITSALLDYENVFIPYIIKEKNPTLELKLRKEYALLLESNKEYRKAIFEYKKIIELSGENI